MVRSFEGDGLWRLVTKVGCLAMRSCVFWEKFNVGFKLLYLDLNKLHLIV